MTASELLGLDFFNEWSVNLECTETSKPDVLRFQLADAVIKKRKESQKENEAIQFHFNLNDDDPKTVVKEMVSC